MPGHQDSVAQGGANAVRLNNLPAAANGKTDLPDPTYFDDDDENQHLMGTGSNGNKRAEKFAGDDGDEHNEEPYDAVDDDPIHDDIEAGLRLRQYTKRSFFSPVLDVLRGAAGRVRPAAPDGIKSGAETPQSSFGFFQVMRTVFDYPDPGMKLRSTAWLDGLRGLAAFEVFIFHYGDGWVDKGIAYGNVDFGAPDWWRGPFIRTLFASGDGAVCLFFAISGFAISHRTLTLLRQRRSTEMFNTLSSAIYRRAIRLFFPVLVETFTLMTVSKIFPNLPMPVDYERRPNYIQELGHWLQAFINLMAPLRYPDRWAIIQNPYDGGISWTIPLEYYGSLMVYIMLLLVSRTHNMTVRMTLYIGIAFHSFVKDDWIAAQFILGLAFADTQVWKEHRAKQRHLHPELEEEEALASSRRSWLPFSLSKSSDSSLRLGRSTSSKVWRRIRPAVFFGIFLLGFYMIGMPPGHLVNGYEGDLSIYSRPFWDWYTFPIADLGLYGHRQMDRYMWCISGIIMVIGISETPILIRGLESRPIQYLGRISFGLYLCHIFMHPFLKWADAPFHAWVGLDPDTDWHSREPSFQLFLAWCLMMLFSIPPNLIVAGLFERFIDRRSVILSKQFETWCLSWNPKEEVQPPPGRSSRRQQEESRADEQPALELQEVGHVRVAG